MTSSRVCIIMSTFNEERDIDRSLDAILSQTIPADVVVIDGGSSDGTISRLRARSNVEPRIHVFADGIRRALPEALNVALERTQAPFVAKVDARTFIVQDFLERALAVFDREGESVACVGGRPEQFGETRFGQGVALARMSPFGVGASGYADSRAYADVDTVQCGVYRRACVMAVGGFDPQLQFGEDEELNWRLRRAGWRIIRDTRVRFAYSTRPTWRAAYTQYRNYGKARVSVWKKHPEFLRLHHLVPSLAVAAGAGLCLSAVGVRGVRPILAGFGTLYAAAAAAAATKACKGHLSSVPYTAAAFSALHLGYGVGMLEGLLLSQKRRTTAVSETQSPRPMGE